MERRRFLLMLLGLPAAACGGERTPRPSLEEQARAFDDSLDCSSAAGLWPAEAKTRTDNEYRDRSQKEGEYCFNCSNYVKPEDPGECGSCRTVKGPIHPLGHCTTWTALQS